MSRPRPYVLEGQGQLAGFSADELALATIGRDGVGYLWDPKTGRPCDDLAGMLTGLPFPFSSDGSYRIDLEPANPVSGKGPFQNGILVDLKSGESIIRFRVPFSDKFGPRMGFTPDGRYFYSAIADSGGGAVATAVWSLPDGNQIYLGKIVEMAISPSGEHFATQSVTDDNQAIMLGLFSIRNQVIESWLTSYSWLTSRKIAAFSSEGDRLVVCVEGGSMGRASVQVWDVRSKQILAEHEIRSYGLYRPRFIHDDQLVAVHQDSTDGPIAICLSKSNRPGIAWKVDSLSANDHWGVRADRNDGRLDIRIFAISADQASPMINEFPTTTLSFPQGDWGGPFKCEITNDASRVAVRYMDHYSSGNGMQVAPTHAIAVIDVSSQKVIWERHDDFRLGELDVQLSPDGNCIAIKTPAPNSAVKVFRLPRQG
ncbi:WD40 repeat domain-containing protein [Stieleria sp. ICT_E10.1]|uniref:WD40 repeat domain-containing protein n=1 Tax=Stieleria sedimenti TaxID=2976331 RepID=UPI00217FB172|nr:WD40 repeat domain-containing protein [Stieleria sedimenti]MCS7468877.1 WD40 repeat domain-containing protein [Stieleria sedimenti]